MSLSIGSASKSAFLKERSKAIVSVYLILKKEEKVLLSLRKNTGYEDGKYGLVSGHVEEGESAKSAMIREAYEEIGVKIKTQSLEFVHLMHRRTERNGADIFFLCGDYEGTIENKEPGKCGELGFFSISALPLSSIDYIRYVLLAFERGESYSETGWEK